MNNPMNTADYSGRDKMVDIAKGISILCVIACHSGFPLTLWINPSTFFLVFFFLVSGFFIKTENNIFDFLKDKFMHLIVLYYFFLFVYAILYYFFCRCSFPKDFFSISGLVIEPLTISHQFPLICPLWFVTTLFEGFCIVAFFRTLLKKISDNTSLNIICIVFLILLAQFVLEIGFFFEELSYPAFVIRSIVASIIICIGYLGWKIKNVWCRKSVFLIVGYIFCFLCWKLHPSYIMSMNDYGKGINKHIFIFCNILGSISVLGIARAITDLPYISGFLVYCGKKSFSLMALHLTGFALVKQMEKLLFSPEKYKEITDLTHNSSIQRSLLFFSGIMFSLCICVVVDNCKKGASVSGQ